MVRFLPPQPDLDHLKNEAKATLKAHQGKDPQVCTVLRHLHRFQAASDEQILASDLTLAEAQFALAMEYGFKSWNGLRQAVLRVQPGANYEPAAQPGALLLPNAPTGQKGRNRFASAYSLALSYLGADADYETVAGDSGLAFILQADAHHKPHGTDIPQLDIGYWPLGHWGALLRLEFLERVYGIPLQVLPLHEDEYRADEAAHYRMYYQQEVERSLRAGRPVVAFVRAAWVVAGLDGGTPPLLGKTSCSDDPDVQRLDHFPWVVIVPGERGAAMDRRQADAEALDFAVRLGRDEFGRELPGKSSGRASFALWRRQLLDPQLCGPHFYHANVVGNWKWNRRAAVGYLRRMAERHASGPAGSLRSAADAYDEVLRKLSAADTGKDSLATQDGRRNLADLIDEVARLEAVAQAHMGDSLKAMG